MHSSLRNTLRWDHYSGLAAQVRELPSLTRAALLLHDNSSVLANLLAARELSVTLLLLNPGMRQAELDALLAEVSPGVLITDHGIQQRQGELEVPLDDPLLLLVPTSATTGKAKIVSLTRSGFDAMSWVGNRVFGLGKADTLLNLMPAFHLQGLMSSYQTLLAGGSVVMAQQLYGERGFLPLLDEVRPTWYSGGPALHRAIVDEVRRAGGLRGRSTLRFIRSIGAALPPSLLRELEDTLEAPVIEGYGMTETGTVTSNPLPPGRRKPGSAGLPAEAEIRIAGDGEIIVRSNCLMSGYWGNPQATAETLKDGWLHTGDLGRLDDDGFLWVSGRKKELINRGGEKVLPGEVDAALLSHPAISEAAAFPVAHPTLGEDVAAAIVIREGAHFQESEFRQHLHTRLSGFKVPSQIIAVSAFPKGATGKPQRHVLSRLYSHSVQVGREATPGIAALWQAALQGRRPPGPVPENENFFAAGGDSFALTTLIAATANEHGELGDLAAFLENPTPLELATLVDSAASHPRREPFTILQEGTGNIPPLFCLPGADSDPFSFRHLAHRLGSGQPVIVLQSGDAMDVEGDVSRLLGPLRNKQPQGPYYLVGHCYGGLVAFEMARCLEALGQRIALLGLIDSPTPGYPKLVRSWRSYLRQAVSGSTTFADLRKHLAWLTRRVSPQPSPIQGTEVFVKKVVAARSYSPGRFGGKVTIVLAGYERYSTRVLEDPRFGWRDFAAGGSEVHRVSGGHNTILAEPHVAELAGVLSSSLIKRAAHAAAGSVK